MAEASVAVLFAVILDCVFPLLEGSALAVRISPAASKAERLSAASSMLRESPLIDGNNALARHIRWVRRRNNLGGNSSLTVPSGAAGRLSTSLSALQAGHVAAQVWSLHVPCEAQFKNAVQLLMEEVDLVKRLLAPHWKETLLATSSSEILQEFSRKRLASVLCVKGAHALGSSMAVIRSLYDLGVRCLSLTHGCHTPWAECSRGRENDLNGHGLTQFGKEVILELNRLGFLIDLSRSSFQTSYDTLMTSQAPIVFAGGGALALCNSATNVPDEILSLLAEKDGVVMVTFDSHQLTCTSNGSVADVIRHINHIRTMAGVDHVGIAAEYEEDMSPPSRLADSSKYPEVFAELLKDKSWSLQDMKKLAGLNFLRVLDRVEKVRDSLRDQPPSESIIPIHSIADKWPCRYKFSSFDPRFL